MSASRRGANGEIPPNRMLGGGLSPVSSVTTPPEERIKPKLSKRMINISNATVAGIGLAICLLGAAHAGPLEDGKNAAMRGDIDTAIRLWEPLAKAGDANAQLLLGITYSRGEGVPLDWGRAGTWFRLAAGQGNPVAQFFLAGMNLGGLGAPIDTAKARDWALRSANAGFVKAQTMMGAFAENGVGGVPDYVQAMQWYRKAAAQNDSAAQTSVGRLYENGLGVTRDYALAAKWYLAASDNLHTGPGAKFSLGRMYEGGYGVGKDAVEALKFYCITEHMDPISPALLAEVEARSAALSKTMTTVQIAEASRQCDFSKVK